MIEAILKGISFGLLLSVFIGPVFMYLIEVSLKRGIKQALFVDFGIFLSDFLCIIISYFFLNQLKGLQEEGFLVGLITGIIFTLFGLGYLLKSRNGKTIKPPKEVIDDVKSINGRHYAVNIIKGFVLNMINPSVILYWLTVMAIAVDWFGSGNAELFVFFTALLITFFGIDVLKIIGAAYLRKFLKDSIIARINIFTGVTFLLAGVFFLIKSLVQM